MNRSFRTPEKEIPVPVTVAVKQRQRQQQLIGGCRNSVLRDNEEELGLFLEMNKRETERHDLLLHNAEAEFDSSDGSRTGSFGMFSVPSATTVRKTGADEFLNSENDKNDYEWLLTPPGTRLFPSLEMESKKPVVNQNGIHKVHHTALKSILSSTQPEVSCRNGMASRARAASREPSIGPHGPSSSGRRSSGLGSGSRPSTPAGTQARAKSNQGPKNNPTSNTNVRPKSSMPTSRPIMSSSKPTTTVKTTAKSSTPTSRPSLSSTKPTPRGPTAPQRPAALSNATKTSAPLVKPFTVTNSVSSLNARPRPWKPHEMPGYTLDAPPNLRTSLTDRPIISMRGRAGAPSSRSSSIEPVPNGKVRRQSCSPSRGGLPNGVNRKSGSSVPIPALNRAYAKAHDNMTPGLYGTKMVERVVNMRKLVPPKQDDKHSPHSNSKPSSPDISGFGRSLSKKSLDMAMRHMDIRRTLPGNSRPLMTKVVPTRGRTISASGSTDATNSNASSEMSVNNRLIDEDVDDETNSIRGR